MRTPHVPVFRVIGLEARNVVPSLRGWASMDGGYLANPEPQLGYLSLLLFNK
jgi:hypothetical protein